MKTLLKCFLLLSLTVSTLAAAHEWDFDKPDGRFGRDRSFRLEKITLDLDLDIRGKKISGTSALHFSPIRSDARKIEIDSVGLDIQKVTLNGGEVSFEKTDEKIFVTLPANAQGKAAQVLIQYSGSPKKGLYFIYPDTAYPKKPYQAWTQGQDENSRYWFPVYDYPNDKAQTEMTVRVDSDFIALSNGALVDTKTINGKKQFHFKQKIPHSSYLVTLVAGQFEIVEQKHADTVLQYLAKPGWRDRLPDIFGRTDALISFFGEIAGRKYPYEKYAQVIVEDFIYGGMENTSATTLNDYVLYPAKDHADWRIRMDSIIGHELAHQWFGDLLTCENWNHTWLNEGFATYLAAWGFEKIDGKDEFALQMEDKARNIIDKDNTKPSAPDRQFQSATTSGVPVYDRGAWVIHMLRMQMGDELFSAAIKRYVEAFEAKTVVTSDFQRVLERTSGLTLADFFEKWVHRGGYLKLSGGWEWNNSSKTAVVRLSQEPIAGETSLYYRVDVPIEIETKEGVVHQSISLVDASTKVKFALQEKPKTIRIDPEHRWLRKLSFDRSDDEWIADLDSSKPMLVRMDAARALGGKQSTKVTTAVSKTLASDANYGVRINAARSLGEIGTLISFDALLKNLKQENPHVRKQIVISLKSDSRTSTAKKWAEITEKDVSDLVVSEAAFLLASKKPLDHWPTIEKLAHRSSHRQTIAARTLEGLKESGPEKAFGLAVEKAKYGAPQWSRGEAVELIGTLGTFSTDKRKYFDELHEFVSDPWYKVRSSAYIALAQLGDMRAEPLLTRAIKNELNGRSKGTAETALADLRKGLENQTTVQEVKKKLEELKASQEELKKRLDFLEKKPTP